MLFDSKELKDLIEKNPNLPLVFIVNNELYYEDAYQSFANSMKVRVGKITTEPFYEVVYDDPQDLREAIYDSFGSNPDYEHLNDEEFEKAVDEEFNKYNWQEAIIIALS